ncbi:MAG: hypothetical protein RL660_421 [Bacteroidota bacterium]|jgi:hypothetical protein
MTKYVALAFFAIIAVFFCCSNKDSKPTVSNFYYWRTTYKLCPSELAAVKQLQTKRIYYRAFDLKRQYAWETNITPTQVFKWQQEPIAGIEYVPVVFIDNAMLKTRASKQVLRAAAMASATAAAEAAARAVEAAAGVIETSDTSTITTTPSTDFVEPAAMPATDEVSVDLTDTEIAELAAKIVALCKQINAYKNLPCNEIQVDCDWSVSTSKPFFLLIEEMKKHGVKITSTLRLWQYKDPTTAGVPPVDEVTLMCYNMGNADELAVQNSIINLKDVKAYLKPTSSYAKKVKIALPIFHWYSVLRDDKFFDIIYEMPDTTEHWRRIDNNTFVCTQSHYADFAKEWKEGDKIKAEIISQEEFTAVQQYINKLNINTAHETIYFALDSTQLAMYGPVIGL